MIPGRLIPPGTELPLTREQAEALTWVLAQPPPGGGQWTEDTVTGQVLAQYDYATNAGTGQAIVWDRDRLRLLNDYVLTRQRMADIPAGNSRDWTDARLLHAVVVHDLRHGNRDVPLGTPVWLPYDPEPVYVGNWVQDVAARRVRVGDEVAAVLKALAEEPAEAPQWVWTMLQQAGLTVEQTERLAGDLVGRRPVAGGGPKRRWTEHVRRSYDQQLPRYLLGTLNVQVLARQYLADDPRGHHATAESPAETVRGGGVLRPRGEPERAVRPRGDTARRLRDRDAGHPGGLGRPVVVSVGVLDRDAGSRARRGGGGRPRGRRRAKVCRGRPPPTTPSPGTDRRGRRRRARRRSARGWTTKRARAGSSRRFGVRRRARPGSRAAPPRSAGASARPRFG